MTDLIPSSKGNYAQRRKREGEGGNCAPRLGEKETVVSLGQKRGGGIGEERGWGEKDRQRKSGVAENGFVASLDDRQ